MSETGTQNTSETMAKLAIAALENKKAEDIRIIDISEISSLGDYFILASGLNRVQLQTMSDEVERVLAAQGHLPRQIEGYDKAHWVLLDYNDIIIHLFDNENRLFYNLERIWRDGKEISRESFA